MKRTSQAMMNRTLWMYCCNQTASPKFLKISKQHIQSPKVSSNNRDHQRRSLYISICSPYCYIGKVDFARVFCFRLYLCFSDYVTSPDTVSKSFSKFFQVQKYPLPDVNFKVIQLEIYEHDDSINPRISQSAWRRQIRFVAGRQKSLVNLDHWKPWI